MNQNTQSGSQWDGLRHFGFLEHRIFYNKYGAFKLFTQALTRIGTYIALRLMRSERDPWSATTLTPRQTGTSSSMASTVRDSPNPPYPPHWLTH